ncbi:universal stress protein [Raineyella fluvialis]|uniref:Universal stress protein n=1 Tax=Raineyella fluvialis TaxID=2662261 RepID=A0A5Q2FDQ9_9ACTN|nr:universal stress protein [Raineyella fluvialis]QGF23917.1 universal stress protein [Raineyella fluvialis]
MPHDVPQPHPTRITPFTDHPIVVGIVPGQPDLVALTAISLARASGATLYFAYVDPERSTVEEFADGTVRHTPLDPDAAGDTWRRTEEELKEAAGGLMAQADDVAWEFRYLAGRPDRALTHLARAIDAATFVVGAQTAGLQGRVRELLEGSVSFHLTHHQHRPVLIVPLQVVDWYQPVVRG